MADTNKTDKSPPKSPQGARPQTAGARPKGGKAGAQPAPTAPAAPAKRAAVSGEVPPRLRERFRTDVIPALMKERGYANPFQVPRLEKIVINMGVGEGKENPKVLDFATADLEAITGQKPVVTRAKKSIANFKPSLGQERLISRFRGSPFNRTRPGRQLSRGGSLESVPGSAGAREPAEP
jgi:hypothetical protein